MSTPYMQPQQTLYQADPAFVQSLHRVREQLHGARNQCTNRPVRIQMIDGLVYEGTVAHMDDTHLYLQVAAQQPRGFFGPWGPSPVYNDVILPLVLYNLLVISLL